MSTIAVVGNVNVETTVPIPGFPLEYTPTIYVRNQLSSGVSAVGYNLAKALRTLGNTVALASVVGPDAQAALVRAQLAADQIDDAYVVEAASRTAQSIILYDPDGRRAVLTDLKDVAEATYPLERFRPALQSSDLVVLTNIAYSKPFVPLVQSLGKPIATDLHTITSLDDAYNRPFLESATILFMSGELLGRPPAEWASAVLAACPAQVVVIGLGSQGAQLAVRGSAINKRFPAVTTRPIVHTGGAGDALFAAFLHTYLLTNDPVRSLRAALVFASYKIGEVGSGTGFLDAPRLAALAASLDAGL